VIAAAPRVDTEPVPASNLRMFRTSVLVLSCVVVLAACKGKGDDGKQPEPASAPAAKEEAKAPVPVPEPAAQPVAEPPAEPPPGPPFTIEDKGKQHVFAEACLMNMLPPWTVMVPMPGAKACDVTGEDDFAISFELKMCGDDAKTCALPPPGKTFDTMISCQKPRYFEGMSKITVVRHAKPYLILSIEAEGGDEGSFNSIGGEMKVLVDDASTGGLVDPASWK